MNLERKPALSATLVLIGFIGMISLIQWLPAKAVAVLCLILALGMLWWLLYDLFRLRQKDR